MMTSSRELLRQISDPNLSTTERVQLRCRIAKQFETLGNHQAACGAMDSLWRGVGKAPDLEGLDLQTSAEVLLRVGVLTGWIGSIKIIKDSQQRAKTLINASIATFDSLADFKKVAEAQIELALCCAREGALDVARELYREALACLDDEDGDLKALAILRSAIVESRENRLNDSLNMLTTAAALFEGSTSHVLRGCFHGELAKVLNNLGISESRPDYIDRVFKEYAAASFQFEQAGHLRYQGVVENNRALLFLHLGKFAEAHSHLDCAQALYTRLEDRIHLAGLEDSRARVLLAEGAVTKAAKIVQAAIAVLQNGDQPSALAEALTTHAVALSRLNEHEQARAAFKRAVRIAEQAGDLELAGRAALSMLEQLNEHLSEDELCLILERALSLLSGTQHTDTLHRLTKCAYQALSLIHTARPDWKTFSLTETLRRHEGRFIKMALDDSGGSITKAAGLLGLPGHQTLSFMLNSRHQQLLKSRTPVKPRRRRLLKMIPVSSSCSDEGDDGHDLRSREQLG